MTFNLVGTEAFTGRSGEYWSPQKGATDTCHVCMRRMRAYLDSWYEVDRQGSGLTSNARAKSIIIAYLRLYFRLLWTLPWKTQESKPKEKEK